MAKSQKTSTREKRKLKSADAKPKSKIPRYMTGNTLSSAPSTPLKIGQKR